MLTKQLMKTKIAMSNIQENNKVLVEKYPFLKPYGFDGKEIDDYDYSYTELDSIPIGWRNLQDENGIALLDALSKAIADDGYKLGEVRIFQAKEKYGSLRLYFSHDGGNLDRIVRKYEMISEETCVVCGKKATLQSTGWICPYCEECAHDMKSKHDRMNFVPLQKSTWFPIN